MTDSKFSVVEKMACPQCKGRGIIHLSRSLNSLWEELSDQYLDAKDATVIHDRLAARRDCELSTKPTAEMLVLLDVLKRRDK